MGLFSTMALGLLAGTASGLNYTEPYRPQYHFSPSKNWMNDPSGLLYYNETYHLFFQYNPFGSEWGNMSWGHATSKDLTHWEERPIAFLARGYPETVTEMYFTGSAVADVNNTSGFGAEGKVPLVAMYTSYYPVSQELPSGKKVQADQQSQSIAYSLDEGETWTTYDAENPVIHNPPSPYEAEFENFRDPFVFWHEETQKWVAVTTLASLHKLLIWSSDNLREWSLSSEFGPYNAVGGVWECPNLFQVPVEGAQSAMKWVMVLGLNPGGPPGTVGSGTQYFVGDFNGTSFNPDPASIYPGNDTANWMDWGPDFYAAAGYNGLPSGDVVQIGWMNNWQYGVKVPTNPWRSAMTVPRRLSLKMVDEKVTVLQQPHLSWREVVNHQEKNHWESVSEGSTGLESPAEAFMIDLSFSDHDSDTSLASTFAIAVRASSDFKQETLIGYNFTSKEVFVDRRRSGDISFDNTFGSLYHAPLLADSENRVHLQIFVDWSSVEVLGGQGEVSLTAQIFPDENSTGARLVSVDGKTQDVRLQINGMSSTWH